MRRRAARYTAYTLGALLGIAALIVAGFAARLAVGPISLNVFATEIREAIGEKLYYAYDVKFDDILLSWSDGHGNLGLSMVAVRVADYSLEDIASVPEIRAGLSLGAAIVGGQALRVITVRGPRVRWIRTAGGAVKFDIGADEPGDSGKILEDFLITMAAAPDPDAGEARTLPTVRIVEADIQISDELDGRTTHISHADILIEPDAAGVRSTFALTLETPRRPVRVSAEGLYRTADQRMTVAVRLDSLRLGDFALAAPSGLLALVPDEPMSGSISVEMDKFFAIDRAAYALEGPATEVTGTAHADASAVSLEARYLIDGRGLAQAWPAGIGEHVQAWAAQHPPAERIALALAGTLNRLDDTLNMAGTVGPPPTPIAVSGAAARPTVTLGALPASEAAASGP